MQNSHTVKPIPYEPIPTSEIKALSWTAPFKWLKAGVQDFKKAPAMSLSYGLIFALIGMGISYASINQPQFALTFWTGFLLVGPFLAVGLYRIAQLREQGADITTGVVLRSIFRHKGQIAIFIAMMMLIMVAWIRFSTLMVALYFGQMSPGIEAFSNALTSAEGITFLAILFASGGLFAFVVFAASALTLPMVIDEKSELIPALLTSFKAVFKQPGPMLVWAALIAGLTFLGMATFFIGLAFIFPLLGYATWHSYKDLVKQ
jgi:uncharacterized membrane protein